MERTPTCISSAPACCGGSVGAEAKDSERRRGEHWLQVRPAVILPQTPRIALGRDNPACALTERNTDLCAQACQVLEECTVHKGEQLPLQVRSSANVACRPYRCWLALLLPAHP
jgi:hypothetical protein